MTRTVKLLNEHQSVDEDENETSEEIETEEVSNQYWPYDLSHAMRRAHVSARNTKYTKKRKTGKVLINDKQNRLVLTFTSHHRFYNKHRAGKSILIIIPTLGEAPIRCSRGYSN